MTSPRTAPFIGARSRRTADGVALLFAMAFPSLTVWIYFIVLADASGRPNLWLQTTYSLGKVLQFGFPLLWLAMRTWGPLSGEPRWASPFRLGTSWWGLAVGAGFGLAVGAAANALYFGVLRPELLDAGLAGRVRQKVGEFGLASPAGYLLLAFFLAAIHSFLEEYYWRWFVYGAGRQHLRPRWANLVSSLGFMAHHVIVLAFYLPGRFWTGVVPLSVCIAVGGGFWAWLYQRTGALGGVWISHLLVDAAILFIGFDLMMAG